MKKITAAAFALLASPALAHTGHATPATHDMEHMFVAGIIAAVVIIGALGLSRYLRRER